MCKFCESKKPVQISKYDNRDAMNISYGQYQGVNVESFLYMHGSMLILDGWGSYRSPSDCYYEDWGLDINNKNSKDSQAQITRIKFCPFCGRDLSNDNTFKVEDAKRKYAENKDTISKLEHNKKIHNVMYAYIVYDAKAEYEKLHDSIYGKNPKYTDIGFASGAHEKYEAAVKDLVKDLCARPIESFDDVEYILIDPNNRQSRYVKEVTNKSNVQLSSNCRFGNRIYIQSTMWRATDEEIDNMVQNNNLYTDDGGWSHKKVTKKKVEELRKNHNKDMKYLDSLKKEQIKLNEIIKKK